MLITIDGPAKSGKSKAAELLAQWLGYRHLNTGQMYRAAGLLFRRLGLINDISENKNQAAVQQIINAMQFDMSQGVVLNGENLTHLVGTLEAGESASVVGKCQPLREKLKAEQRRIAEAGNIICEGRDQGTSVFPKADVKFFITASPAVRATRQAKDMAGDVDLKQLEAEITKRDERDAQREFDPLKPATDAITIDTSNMTIDQVFQTVQEAVERCRNISKA
jgi:CMP/dCMP kinase